VALDQGEFESEFLLPVGRYLLRPAVGLCGNAFDPKTIDVTANSEVVEHVQVSVPVGRLRVSAKDCVGGCTESLLIHIIGDKFSGTAELSWKVGVTEHDCLVGRYEVVGYSMTAREIGRKTVVAGQGVATDVVIEWTGR
jgi:hypothetical protein